MGCIGFPRLLADVPAEAFAAELVEAEGVMLLPGSVYGHPANHFRFGLGRHNFPEALERLDRFAEERLAQRIPAAQADAFCRSSLRAADYPCTLNPRNGL